MSNPQLTSTYSDTFHADLAWDPHGFNDRALITIDLPKGWTSVHGVESVSVTAGSKSLRHRLVAYGVEQDSGSTRLHIQIDVPTTVYMESDWRSSKSKVALGVTR